MSPSVLSAQPLTIRWQDIGQPQVSSLGLAPDGSVLASATHQSIVLREAISGRVLRTVPLFVPWHGCEVAYSPSGDRIAAAIWSDGQGVLRIYETALFTSLGQTMERDLRFVKEITWGADGSAIYTVGSADRAERYDPVSIRRVRVYPTQGREATDLDVSPDGQWLAVALKPGPVALYRTDSSQTAFELADFDAESTSVLFQPNGQRLWVGRSDGRIAEWDIALRVKTREIQTRPRPVTHMETSAHGRLVTFTTDDGWVGNLDTVTFSLRTLSQGHLGPIDDVAVSPDGRRAFSASRYSGFKSRLVFWENLAGTVLFDAFNLDSASYWHAHSPDGLRVYQGMDSGALIERDPSDGRIVRVWNIPGAFRAADVSPDGDWLAVSTGSQGLNPIYLYRLPEGRLERALPGHNGVQTLRFSPDSSTLVSAGTDGKVTAWSRAAGHKLFERSGMPVYFGNVDFSPDGRRLAVCLDDRTVLMDARDGTTLAQLTHTQSSLFNHIRFSPDGRYLALANGPVVAVHCAKGLDLVTTLPAGPGYPGGLQFSPDGRWIWRGTADFPGALRVWDTVDFSGPTIYDETSQAWVINAVGFSPDGRRITFAREDPSLLMAELPDATSEVRIKSTKASDGKPIDVGRLALADGHAARLGPAPPSASSRAVLEGVSPLAEPSYLRFTVRARADISSMVRVRAFDFDAGDYEDLGLWSVGNEWETRTWILHGRSSRFVGPRHRLRCRIDFDPASPLSRLAPWAELDVAGWTVGVP
jgi:WD40 repeat protein